METLITFNRLWHLMIITLANNLYNRHFFRAGRFGARSNQHLRASRERRQHPYPISSSFIAMNHRERIKKNQFGLLEHNERQLRLTIAVNKKTSLRLDEYQIFWCLQYLRIADATSKSIYHILHIYGDFGPYLLEPFQLLNLEKRTGNQEIQPIARANLYIYFVKSLCYLFCF